MNKLLLVLILCSGPLLAQTSRPETFPFQNGDLLFQDLDCGALCDAIEAVTHGAEGRHFSHIGLVYKHQDSLYVIEAIGEDVHLTPLDRFIHRQTDSAGIPKILVGRLRPAYRHLNDSAIRFSLRQIGKPYDDAFLYGNGRYYCSELIYDAYMAANKNRPFFRLQPMTFNDPRTGKPFPAWTDYYKALHLPIPEGKPGCNPGGISTSNRVQIVASFY